MKNDAILQRIKELEDRNRFVEANKAWETSWTRRLSIMCLTYIVVAVYLKYVVHIYPWINALVPVLGFLLSTLTISALKTHWLKHRALAVNSKVRSSFIKGSHART